MNFTPDTPATAGTGPMAAPSAAPEARTAAAVLGLAPRVSLTRLPFGGAVLVHGVSLALAECSERDAHALHRLLELDAEDWRTAPADQRRMAQELTAEGWLALRTTDAEDARSRADHHADDHRGGLADGSTAARTAAQEG
jgi:hypothetical protein